MSAKVARAPDALRVLIRIAAQIAILSLIVFALSTWLWIGIPVYDGVELGHIAVSIAMLLLAQRIVAAASPLASVLSSGVGGGVERVGLSIVYALKLVALLVLYFGYRWLFRLALVTVFQIGPRDAGVLYDTLFLLAASYLVYSLVKALTG